jgi:thioredoxin reductase (NADPH)
MELKTNGKSATKPEHVRNLVLGSGPAGLSAALYTARAQLEPVVLAGGEYGGQVSLTHIVENYPGFPDAVGGPELTELFKKQAERFGARVVFDTATEVDLSSRPFRVKAYEKEYLADSLIIATGATPKHLQIPGETEFTGRGVSYCGTCDGFFFKDKEVIVVGGGDSALEEGAFLTRFANKVTVVHRRNELRASVILQERAKENPKMKFIWDTKINQINGNGAVAHVELENLKSGKKEPFKTDGVFIFIGHTPNTQLFQGKLDMDEAGYIIANKYMESSVPGVFTAGEVSDPHFRQVITSAGMGAAAGIQATRFLENE